MQFTELHKLFFAASDGAYSKVTAREVFDSQVTLTDWEAKMVVGNYGFENIRRGNVSGDKEKSSKEFTLVSANGYRSIKLNLVFPKPEKDELRLYLKKDQFKPEPDEIWFLFLRNAKVHIGSMDEKSWRSIGRSDEDDTIYQNLIIEDNLQKILTPEYQVIASSIRQKRNPLLAQQRFSIAKYKCEIGKECRLFVSRSSGKNYLEAHHFIPLAFQQFFAESLDTIDNITALCPFCHRAIHHAEVDYTRSLVDHLTSDRQKLLAQLNIAPLKLYDFYNCEEIVSI